MNEKKSIFQRIKAWWLSTYDASEYTTDRSARAIIGDRSRQGSEDSLVPQYERDIIIRQCRDVFRNNPIARGLVKRLCDMVVGQGINPVFTTSDKSWNDEAHEWFKAWSEAPEPTGLQSLVDVYNIIVTASLIEGGSAVLLHSDGTIDVIELERFRADPNDATNPYPYQRDRDGRITKWCIHDRNAQGIFDNTKASYSWVKASNILAMFPKDRADQIMPIPQLASCMAELRDVQEINRYTLGQAKVQAIAGLVHKRGASDTKASFGGSRISADRAEKSEEQLRKFADANAIDIIDTDGDVHAIAPATPSGTYESFIKLNLKLIAMAVGIPLDVMMLWFSDGTYSSNKATLTQAHEAIMKRQQMLLRTIIKPLVMWRIRKAIKDGELRQPPVNEIGLPMIRCDWQMPSYEWMDASDSLQSSLLSIRAGLSTLREECEKRGHSLEDMMRAKIDDNLLIKKMAEEAGLQPTDLSDVIILGASNQHNGV